MDVPVEAGEILGARYRLEECVGRGGMSVVWRAHDLVLGRDVAIKVLKVAPASPPDSILTEARATAKLAHPHVANVFDYGEMTDDAGRRVPFVVMELLHGTSLAELSRERPVSPEVALRVAAQVADALAAAHARGLVHRDVKPGNIMVTDAGVKVFDFGLAAGTGTNDDPGPDGQIFGTPSYLAPERISGEAVSAASDVYALGVLLYRMLTGRFLWPVTTTADIVTAHVHLEPPDLPPIPGVPDTVRDLYLRCVAKTPDERPSAREAARVLAAAASGRPPAPDIQADSSADAIIPVPPADRSSRRGLWFAAVAAVVLALMAVAMTQLTGRTPPQAQAGSPAPQPAHDGSASPSGGTIVGATAGPVVEPGGPLSGNTPSPPPPPGGALPPSTTAPGIPAPTTSAPGQTRQTFTSDGGTVVADCYDTNAYLLSWQPAAGYKLKKVSNGPAAQVSALFQKQGSEITMTVTCPAGSPVVDITGPNLAGVSPLF